jgi:hypothetical protein
MGTSPKATKVTARPEPCDQDSVLMVIALNVLTGKLNLEEWRGLTRLDEDEVSMVNLLRQIRRSGFGRLEINVISGRVETAYQGFTYKRKEWSGASTGA